MYSHYLVVVVTGDSVISDSNLLYGYNDNEWRDFGYYVAAIFPANRSNTNFTLGDKTSSTLNGVAYYNGPLEEDTAYRVFIKVYSAADNPVQYFVCTFFYYISTCTRTSVSTRLKHQRTAQQLSL